MINRVWRTHNNNNKSQFIILNEMKQENLFFVYISVSLSLSIASRAIFETFFFLNNSLCQLLLCLIKTLFFCV